MDSIYSWRRTYHDSPHLHTRIRATRPYRPLRHFFFPFFFFTPPVEAVGVLGKLEPCKTGEAVAACEGAERVAEAADGAAGGGGRMFIIF